MWGISGPTSSQPDAGQTWPLGQEDAHTRAYLVMHCGGVAAIVPFQPSLPGWPFRGAVSITCRADVTWPGRGRNRPIVVGDGKGAGSWPQFACVD